ncbi:MAG: tetratricopeptide repeat protein [Deltaproteobacteria bacterium]
MLIKHRRAWATRAILIALTLVINSTASAAIAEDYDSLIRKGDKYYELFDNRRALTEYEKAYTIAPESFDALMKLARAYNDLGEDLKGVKFSPEKSKSPNAAKIEQYWQKAAEYAELLKKKFPDRAETYFLLATTYGHLAIFKDGKEKVRFAGDVEKNCKKAIELDPDFIPAYVALAVYYREVAGLNWVLKAFAKTLYGGRLKGTIQDSERLLLEAMKINPDIIHIHYELAKTYVVMKREDKVAEHLRETLGLPLYDHQDREIKQVAERELKKLAKK